ncbi:hypothetical protein A4A49_18405 [Nicotiana attenuata]|uniref:DUF4283 domain-containing protein n=1 Tax=Nicotiana attenuata TaxID=49451 RepID=A0A1J6JG07_NICAT|nr:hypothetical protein A4A49_18405 [Nicotiana attenuata]
MTKQRKKLPSPNQGDEETMETPALRKWGVSSLKFQPILEEKENDETDTKGIEVHAKQANLRVEELMVHRRLQFSAAATSTQQAPNAKEKTADDRQKKLNENTSSQMGKPLTYIPPSMRDGTFVVQIEKEDTRAQEESLKNGLIGYVLGDSPYEKSMENYVTNVWSFVAKPKNLYHDEGYYIFQFQSIEDRDLVLHAGPYTYHNKPFILQQWKIDFCFNPECLRIIPLWMKFPRLPLGYWFTETLSKLACVVGKPLYTDRVTAKMDKASYARVLVETDVSHPLPESFEMQTPKGVIKQQIAYDWRPKFCCDCIRFGHDTIECWAKTKQVNEEEFKEQPRRRRRNKKKKHITQKWVQKIHVSSTSNDAESSGTQKEKHVRMSTAEGVQPTTKQIPTEDPNTTLSKIGAGQGKQTTNVRGNTAAATTSSNRFAILQNHLSDQEPRDAGPTSSSHQ